jgi:hypothetical protein
MSMHMSIGPRPGLRLLAASGAAFLLFLSARPAAAVPVFARKYHTSCATCHTVFPKLNPFGEAFRLRGYRWPAEAQNEELVKDKPISLGAEGYKKIWPEALWPTDLPAHVPLAINTKFANVYASSNSDAGREITHNDFQFPQEANLFGAGTLGENFAFFGEVTWAQRPDGGADTELEHAQIQVNSPFGPENAVNFKLGRFAPNFAVGFQEMWIMTDNAIDTLFSYDPIGLRGGTGVSDSPLGISLPARIQGIEMWGVAQHRLFYTVGVANGIGPGAGGTFDANSGKDFYARIDWKFGGMALDGDTTGVTLPPENWREKSLRLGLFGYYGNGSHIQFPFTAEDGSQVQIEDPRYNRVGLYASWYYQDLNVFGVALRGSDRLRELDSGGGLISERSRDYNSWFVQADYVLRPPLQLSLRYENLRPADRAAPKVEALNANFSFLVRANVKAMLEYHRDLKDSKNYSLNTLLRFAY